MTEILVVDDSVATGKTIEFVLAKEGYDVVLATDGVEALLALGKHPDCALIITDLQMPSLNGQDLVAALRENQSFSKIPILAMSAASGTREIEKVLQAGATGFLPKPIAPHQLLLEVETMCSAVSGPALPLHS